MDIRKTDNKGRVAIGKKGANYFTSVYPDGSVTLTPVPESSEVPSKGMRIFNRPMGTGKTTELVKIMLEPGNGDVYFVAPTRGQAEIGYRIAKEMIVASAKSDPEVTISYKNLGHRFISASALGEMEAGTRYVIDEIDGVIGALVGGSVLAIAGTDGKIRADQIENLRRNVNVGGQGSW